MKARALVLGIAVSVALLAAAGVLYALAAGAGQGQYRDAIRLTRQIQQLSSQWSVEIARVKSDPLADFDSLAAFIPRMAQFKRELSGTVRAIAGLPDRLASDVAAYLSALDAQEERVERFKTGYAVVRNSTRYLPLAAANVTRQAQEAGEEALGQRMTTLVQEMNLYLAGPTETAHGRLAEEIGQLREASVAQAPALANGMANFIAHAEVLLEKQGPTEELFERATSGDIGALTERLVGGFEFELGKQARQSAWYERGMLGVIALLALFWVGLAVQQRVRGAELRRLPDETRSGSNRLHDGVRLMTYHHGRRGGRQRGGGSQHVADQRASGEAVQHLRPGPAHAAALAGGQHDDMAGARTARRGGRFAAGGLLAHLVAGLSESAVRGPASGVSRAFCTAASARSRSKLGSLRARNRLSELSSTARRRWLAAADRSPASARATASMYCT